MMEIQVVINWTVCLYMVLTTVQLHRLRQELSELRGPR